MIEVISPGVMSTVQDSGRQGLMHMGVGRSGAIDPLSFQVANRLVENSPDAAAIEIVMPPAEFLFHQAGWIALTGSPCHAWLDDVPVWLGWRVPVEKGQRLKLRPARNGFASYLAVSGGIDVPMVMGSASTDRQSGFGGFHRQGLALAKGDCLTVGEPRVQIQQILGVRLPHWNAQLRVIEGPEFAQFSAQSQADFFETGWRMDANSNRMGFRLQGVELKRDHQADILSQAVFAGVIQVPPNGLPIVLAAEAQSTGGYPRIGVIIQADRWKLGQSGIGQYVRFMRCTQAQAYQALRDQQAYLDKIEYVIAAAR